MTPQTSRLQLSQTAGWNIQVAQLHTRMHPHPPTDACILKPTQPPTHTWMLQAAAAIDGSLSSHGDLTVPSHEIANRKCTVHCLPWSRRSLAAPLGSSCWEGGGACWTGHASGDCGPEAQGFRVFGSWGGGAGSVRTAQVDATRVGSVSSAVTRFCRLSHRCDPSGCLMRGMWCICAWLMVSGAWRNIRERTDQWRSLPRAHMWKLSESKLFPAKIGGKYFLKRKNAKLSQRLQNLQKWQNFVRFLANLPQNTKKAPGCSCETLEKRPEFIEPSQNSVRLSFQVHVQKM